MKRCLKCGETKELSEFYKSSGRSGYRPYCKSCMRIDEKRVIERNKSNPKETPEFVQCSSCKCTKSMNEFYSDNSRKNGLTTACKVCVDEKIRKSKASLPDRLDLTKHVRTCPRCRKTKARDDFGNSKTTSDGMSFKCLACMRELSSSRKERVSKIHLTHKVCCVCKERKEVSDFRKDNRGIGGYSGRCKVCYNAAAKQRKKSNPAYKIADLLRNRLRCAIKNKSKRGSAVRDLGCTIQELIVYLESKFDEGMTWDNYTHSGWHIDHIIPLAAFDLTDREQILKACHYTNLQPLWAKDNYRKSDNVRLP